MSENALVGRATYINGDVQEFTEAGEQRVYFSARKGKIK